MSNRNIVTTSPEIACNNKVEYAGKQKQILTFILNKSYISLLIISDSLSARACFDY